MSVMQNLGVNQQHYYSQGDQLGRCPQCFGSSVQNVGTLNVNGTAQDVTNCTACNRLFTGANGGIQSLVQEAQQLYNTQNVGFQSQMALGQQIAQGMQQYQYIPPDNSYKLDTINSSLTLLLNQMSNLTQEILRVANQNQDLMTKLATDPLVNIRKIVSDFNLE